MPEIAPFRGLYYDSNKISDFSKVVIPPYDVISPQEQDCFYQLSPYNMIRLELGKSTPEDTAQNNVHTRSADCLREWRREGVLLRDDKPAIYYYELDYSLSSGARLTRCGFLCMLRLEDFSSGRVRPHERTFQAAKDERLQLMLACHANFSPVFALYSDPQEAIDKSLKAGRDSEPLIRFVDRHGMEHRLWRVEEESSLKQARDLIADKPIFIADGHHRYETALNYRALMRERFPQAGSKASFEYIMIYLSNLNQRGLTILPTHRLLRSLEDWDSKAFLAAAEGYFDVLRFGADERGKTEWRAALEGAGARKASSIGFYHGKSESLYLLTAKPSAVTHYLSEKGIAGALQSLDVVILDQLILRKILNLSDVFLSNADNIHFKHDMTDAYSDVRSGKYEAGFFINSTRMEQVQEVATAGLVMPHKSTYFYPKVGSGMIVRPIIAEEVAPW